MSAISYFKEKGKSGYQEKIAEHVFSKDLLISAATNFREVFISRNNSDNYDYGIIVQSRQPRKTMVIQLRVYNGATRVWYADRQLLSSKAGQLILMNIKEKNGGLEFSYFIFNKKRLKEVLIRPSQKTNPEKCRTRKSDYIKVSANKLYDKLFR